MHQFLKILYYLLPYTLLANPKSQIFTVQSSFNNTFAGFKSLCNTLAECKYLRPTIIL